LCNSLHIPFIEVNAKTGANVDEAFYFIVQCILFNHADRETIKAPGPFPSFLPTVATVARFVDISVKKPMIEVDISAKKPAIEILPTPSYQCQIQ